MSTGLPKEAPRQGEEPEVERRLVEQAKTDPLAFGRLFDAYYNRILNYVLHRTADVYVAQELTSNVFYNAMKSLGKFRWRSVPFGAWLYRIATNEVNGHYRRRARSRTANIDHTLMDQLVDPTAGTDQDIITAQQAAADNKLFLELHAAIAGLSAEYQEVIVLHYFEKKSLEEIKLILGKPMGSVKSRLHRGRKLLRVRMQASYLKLVE
jgi:RNA polymerase sigma-70 factor (ECF subfamily)